MNTITFTVTKRSGDHIKTAVGPSNRSEETHFGTIDYVIVGFFVLSVGGLVLLFTMI